jgi:hypothetical protein
MVPHFASSVISDKMCANIYFYRMLPANSAAVFSFSLSLTLIKMSSSNIFLLLCVAFVVAGKFIHNFLVKINSSSFFAEASMIAPEPDVTYPVCAQKECPRGYYLHPEFCDCFLACDYIMECKAGSEWDFVECGCVVRS